MGGRSGVQRIPNRHHSQPSSRENYTKRTSRFGAEGERFDLTKTQLSSKMSPHEIAMKNREWVGRPGEMSFQLATAEAKIFFFTEQKASKL